MSDLKSSNTTIISGSGNTTLVFLHYYGGAAQTWQWVTAELTSYRCIALNLPGFGNAPALAKPGIEAFAEYVHQQLESLGVSKYVLIGHSMGGKIAMQVTSDQSHTGAISKLILLAPSPPTIERMPDEEKKRMLHHPNADEAAVTAYKGAVQPLSDQQFELAIATQLMVDETTWHWWIEEGMGHSIADQVKELTLPITLIVSKDDPAITWQMTEEDIIPNLPPQTKVITTENIGHLYPYEVPAWLAEILKGEANC